MKKTFFIMLFGMLFTMSLGSCGNSTASGDNETDSTNVDSTLVDSMSVDSLSVDTVVVK